jgi:tRNA threonylcarbamoyladenosine biosynthesis protein TsaE
MIHIELNTQTAEQTMAIAERIGKNLKGGEVVELVADVGGGKTTFVRGLAKGAGSKNHVSSPTFTISKVYQAPKFEIVHFDFYRLEESGLIEYEIQEAIFDPITVIVVEWSDVIKHILPEERLVISIYQTHEDERTLSFAAQSKLRYLLEGV